MVLTNNPLKLLAAIFIVPIIFPYLSSGQDSGGLKDLNVHIVVHSHADLSWPDEPEICTNLNCQAIEQSIDILEELPEFKFSEEDVFVFQEYLRRNPNRKEVVRELLRRNILECGGFYFGPSELLLGGEGLIRNIYFGKRWLRDTFGINTEMAWNVDEPGHTLQMPQILAKAGIKYFLIWKTLTWDNLSLGGYVGPSLFRWEAPDGSMVLVNHCFESYGAGHMLRTDFKQAEESFRAYLDRAVEHIAKWNLPPVLLLADGSDCTIPDEKVAINAARWNEKYGAPAAQISSTTEFFEAAQRAANEGKGKIETIGGEIPCWWDGTQPVENDAFMLTRHLEYMVNMAEKFATVNDMLLPDYDYPGHAIEEIWKGKLWVHEHNWGGTNGRISDAIKLARAREAFRLADDVLDTSLNTFVSNIRCKDIGIPVVILNGLSWSRKDIAEYELSLPSQNIQSLHMEDGSGNEIPIQIQLLGRHPDGSIARARIIFEATVPSLGYVTYYLISGERKCATTTHVSTNILENDFYIVTLDPESMGINDIFDKVNGKSILNTSAYRGNELIALENKGVDEGEIFTGRCWKMGEKNATATIEESGPVRAVLRIDGKLMDSGQTQRITIYNSIPRIDLETVLDWNGQKEIQINIAFPFHVENPLLTYEVPFGMVEYGKENPYAMAIHPTIRAANNWIDLSNHNMGVTLATEVTPFDTKDRLDRRFMDARSIKPALPGAFGYRLFRRDQLTDYSYVPPSDPVLQGSDFIIQPVLLRSVFSCGDKNLYFTQRGKHVYKFAIQTHRGGLVPHEAARLGWEHNSPLIVLRGQSGAGDLGDAGSFAECSEPNVLITVVKRAEDGDGIILRCYETDGTPTKAIITLNEEFSRAFLTNIIEDTVKDIPMKGNSISISLDGHAIETYRIVK